MNKEFKRMMELAGLTEIKVNDPGPKPEWVGPESKPATILINAYYSDWGAYVGNEPVRDDDDLYIKKGEKGWYDEDKETFESFDENSTVRVKPEYISYKSLKEIKINNPVTEYYVFYNLSNFKGQPHGYSTMYSKQGVIDKLNKTYRDITGLNYDIYTLDDMSDMYGGTYINDDYALVTDDEDRARAIKM